MGRPRAPRIQRHTANGRFAVGPTERRPDRRFAVEPTERRPDRPHNDPGRNVRTPSPPPLPSIAIHRRHHPITTTTTMEQTIRNDKTQMSTWLQMRMLEIVPTTVVPTKFSSTLSPGMWLSWKVPIPATVSSFANKTDILFYLKYGNKSKLFYYIYISYTIRAIAIKCSIRGSSDKWSKLNIFRESRSIGQRV